MAEKTKRNDISCILDVTSLFAWRTWSIATKIAEHFWPTVDIAFRTWMSHPTQYTVMVSTPRLLTEVTTEHRPAMKPMMHAQFRDEGSRDDCIQFHSGRPPAWPEFDTRVVMMKMVMGFLFQ